VRKKISPLQPKVIINALLRNGFYIHHQKGSHVHLRHRLKTYLRVTIPFHTKFDLPISVTKSILKQADITRKDFLKLL